MVRKSERNKATTEKVEKPTTSRKSTRSTRRRKKSTSESEPDAEVQEETTTDEIPLPSQSQVLPVETPEVPEVKSRRGRPRRHVPVEEPTVQPEESRGENNEWNEDGNFWGEASTAETSEAPKMDSENSTWKIQSSNGSGGEIQKLKICRQRLTDSAESSSSPAKEVASPRRKRYRKRKEKHLEGDDAESTGSHTDTEVHTSTLVDTTESTNVIDTTEATNVIDTTESVAVICEVPSAELEVESSVVHQEVTLPLDEMVQADSTSVNQAQENDVGAGGEESAAEAEPEQPLESVGGEEIEPVVEDAQETVEVIEQQDLETSVVSADEVTEAAYVTCTSADVTYVISEELAPVASDEQNEVAEEQVLVEPVQLVEEPEPESGPGLEPVPVVVEPEPVVVEPEPVSVVPEPVAVEPAVSEPSKEEEETKPAKKTHKKNLKLSVSHEDAMQQIAMKLNERAARFSKEATEEAAKRLAPAKHQREEAIDEEEEGEISRDRTSTKTLELKRLDDDDNEPTNKKHERCRRPVTGTSPSTPSGMVKDLAIDAPKHDVSTETLKVLLPDVRPVAEEKVQSVFSPKENELEAEQINSDDAGSTGEVGEVEEEGELIEDESEDKKRSAEDRHGKFSKVRRSSRDEAKKPERRVTKESKKGRGDRKDSRSSTDEPRPKKRYERDESKKEGRRSGEKSDQTDALRTEENHKPVRKISIVPDDAKSIRRSVSPPTKKPSSVLFITNLVRPFTIAQLRELLARTGTITPNGFFMDRIKSKCWVKYNDVEMAIETRHALHGVKWPSTNPRTLRVEFSNDEAMEAVKKLAEEEDDAAKRQDLAAQNLDASWYPEKDVIKPPRKPKNLVREWDMGKDASEIAPIQEVIKKKGKEEEWGVKAKDKRGDKEEGGVRRRHISPSQENSEPARKVKRRETDAPAKLLDDLFRKTKATPCIYWLPLTAAQIAVKEEMRRQHMAEHQKRLAEMRKTDSSRRDKDKSRDRDRERERARDRRRK